MTFASHFTINKSDNYKFITRKNAQIMIVLGKRIHFSYKKTTVEINIVKRFIAVAFAT